MVRGLGGAFKKQPEDRAEQLSPAEKELVERSFEGLDRERLRDYHVHIIGSGAGGTGATISPKMKSWLHPVERFKGRIYMSAAEVKDWSQADQQYLDRFIRLIKASGLAGKAYVLALDHNYNPDGSINPKKTEFYTPNDYVVKLAKEHSDALIPVISVHPYRKDAVEELEQWAKRGIRYVKWLPPAQGMDPADERIDTFYKAMAKNQMVLLTHVGKEMAVKAKTAQEWGNPLRLRRALDLGVKVIMAHCASLGKNQDLDHPGKKAESFQLFLRMMADEKYKDLLFADISALTQVNRLPKPIQEILRRQDLHPRLVNGSDYPLPAVNCVIWTSKFVKLGMITKEQRLLLNEIYDYNPLLFDFVLKRTLRLPDSGEKLSDSIFLQNPHLPN